MGRVRDLTNSASRRIARWPRRRSAALRKAAARHATERRARRRCIDDLVIGNRILYDQGVVDGYGHVSARDPRNPERFLMSRARAPGPGHGRRHHGIRHWTASRSATTSRPVYSERFIHSEDLQGAPRRQLASCTATRRRWCRSRSRSVPLKPIRAPFFYPEVPVFDTRDVAGLTEPPDLQSASSARRWREKLGQNSVVLLRGHGNAVVGATRAHGGLSRDLHRGQCQAAAAGQDARRADQLSRARGGRHHGGQPVAAPARATAPTASGNCWSRRRSRAPASRSADGQGDGGTPRSSNIGVLLTWVARRATDVAGTGHHHRYLGVLIGLLMADVVRAPASS